MQITAHTKFDPGTKKVSRKDAVVTGCVTDILILPHSRFTQLCLMKMRLNLSSTFPKVISSELAFVF